MYFIPNFWFVLFKKMFITPQNQFLDPPQNKIILSLLNRDVLIIFFVFVFSIFSISNVEPFLP